MTIAYEIPLSPDPQSMSVQLSGVQYGLTFRWNPECSCWVLDIRDAGGADLVLAIPLVTGIDLLRQHKWLGIPGALIAQTDYSATARPGYANLGVTGRLYYVTEA